MGEESQVLAAGDVAHIPMDEVHGTYNIFEEPVVFLAILSPAEFDGPALIDVKDESTWAQIKEPRQV